MFSPAILKTYYLKGLSGDVVGSFRFAMCIWQSVESAKMTPSDADRKSPLGSNAPR